MRYPFLLGWLLAMPVLMIACKSRERSTQTSATDLRPFSVQFGWTFDAHHIGFLVAKDHGYYREAQLNVELIPGGLDSSPVRTLVSGGAQLAQVSGVEQLLAARAERLPVRAVAAFHRSSPHALISLSRDPIRAPADLRGKTVAVAFGDTAEFLFKDFMDKIGEESAGPKLVPFRFDLSPLIHGDVDAITGFATDQPHTLKSRGLLPVVVRYGETKQVGYGYMFLAREGTESSLGPFMEASRHGWLQAFTDPEAALDVLQKAIPSLDRSVERNKLEAIRQLMLTPQGVLDTWCIDPQVIETVRIRMARYGQLRAPVDVATTFSNDHCDK